MYCSVIIPIYNEEKSIKILIARLLKVLDKLQAEYEIIFINDGSNDNSLKIIESLIKINNKIKAISFRKNCGKSLALTCGFKFAKGEIIITMDGDLQDLPEEIPKFISKINEGFDMVSGWKKIRYDPKIFIIYSKFFNFVINAFTGTKIHDTNCGFKAYRKYLVKHLNIYEGLFRFIPAIAKYEGFKIDEIVINHKPRIYGKSKYGLGKIFKGFYDLLALLFLLRYIKKPLHFYGFVGLVFLFSGFLINLYLSVLWIMGEHISNRPLLFLGILLMIIGFQSFSAGITAVMISDISSKLDKNYPISKKIGEL